jgi:peptide/nickel transport system ATP-binding protein
MVASEVRMRQIRWRRISMIFQAAMNALNPVHRVQDQIAEAIITHEPELSSHAVAHRARSLFELVKIPENRLQDYPHQFSGGMRQRVIIAMALACNPSLIIADEPTTALDVIVQNQILSAIGTFQKEMNIGMIFISHDLAVVADVCTHIGVMHAGSLVEYGSRQEVLDCPGHPYTRMLVGSLLTLSDEPADLSSLVCPAGTNGPLVAGGCPVQGICSHATVACGVNRPIGWNCQPPIGSAVSTPGRNVEMNIADNAPILSLSDVTKTIVPVVPCWANPEAVSLPWIGFHWISRPARYLGWSERAAAAKPQPAD